MEILINGKQALIKSGSSFEFVSENRLFTGSDSYTLNIEFPLAGCLQNLDIFGYLNRTDIANSTVVFDCELRSGSFHRKGIVTVTEMNETMVKTQFLEGRSALNFKSSFDDIYINELYIQMPNADCDAWNGVPYDMGDEQGSEQENPDICTALIEKGKYVTLPWVNNNSGNVQNDCIPNFHGQFRRRCGKWSFQYYLLHLTKEILNAMYYTCDLTKWEQSWYKDLLCCNALPAAWEISNYAKALPHWTVTRYFEELERILPGEFNIDHGGRSVQFLLTHEVTASIAPVRLSQVLNDFSVERTEQNESEYRHSLNRRYAECSHRMWKFYSCHWLPKEMSGNVRHFNSFEQMRASLEPYMSFYSDESRPMLNDIFYAWDISTYFVLDIVQRTKTEERWRYWTRLQPVNQFGAYITDKTSEDYDEQGIVPAWIDSTDYGDVIFLECSEYDEKEDVEEPVIDDDYLSTLQTTPVNRLGEGERTGSAEYYDKIYVAYWQKTRLEAAKYYRPVTDEVTMLSGGWDISLQSAPSLRLGSPSAIRLNGEDIEVSVHKIDALRKYKFRFLSDTLPNARAVFYINGGKYLCKKLTATFTERGMSQLIKGEFYKVL